MMQIEQLIEILPRLNCDVKEARKIGREAGLSRHDIQALRHILGYSEEKLGGKLTTEQKEAIAREYEDGGVSIHKLAIKYDVGYNSIYCILKCRKVDTHNPRRWSPQQEMRLVDCVKKGMPLRTTSALIGKCKSTIEKKIARMRRDGKL